MAKLATKRPDGDIGPCENKGQRTTSGGEKPREAKRLGCRALQGKRVLRSRQPYGAAPAEGESAKRRREKPLFMQKSHRKTILLRQI